MLLCWARSLGILRLSLVASLLVIVALGVGGLLFASRSAHAAGFSVTDCSTYGTAAQAGTLAKALADAAASSEASDTITFACDTSGSGLDFPSSYAVSKGLSLDASGHDVTFTGNDASRFFTVNASGKLSLTHLALTHGFGDTPGGAIQVTGGSLTVTNSTFTDNVDNDPNFTDSEFRGGGALAVIGGTLTVTGSAFTHNSVPHFEIGEYNPGAEGGAITLQGSAIAPLTATVDTSTFSDNSVVGGIQGGSGGAIYAESVSTSPTTRGAMQLTIIGSTFTGNAGSGIGVGGAVGANNATIAVSASTFSENQPDSTKQSVIGGGIGVYNTDLSVTVSTFTHNLLGAITVGSFNGSPSRTDITQTVFSGNDKSLVDGGGALDLNTDATVSDSTFTGNSTSTNIIGYEPGGGGAIENYGALTLVNDTITGNSVSVSGGFRGSNIYDYHDDTHSGTITYRNTIVANGSGDANCYYEASGVATDGGYNLDSGTSCGFSSGNHSLTNTDPKLAALADNGGPTQTMALLTGSSAIDAASASVCAAAPVNGIDQRGVARPQGPACDIGAFELVPIATTATTIMSSAGEVACGQRVTFTAHVTSASGAPVGSVTFKDGSTSLGTSVLNTGYASFSVSSLKTGTHSVSVVYPAGHGFLGSASGAVAVIVGGCEGGGGSGLDPNAPTPHPLFETPTATLAPASTATPSVSKDPAIGDPILFALVGSGTLLLLLLAGGGFFYLRRRNGGVF
jgi:hypothetical protein